MGDCVHVLCKSEYDELLCGIKGNTAANAVQIDVELYLSLALSFSISQ